LNKLKARIVCRVHENCGVSEAMETIDDLYCIVLYLSISISLLTAKASQKRCRHSNWHCVRAYTPKRYRQLQVKDLSKVPTWRLERHSDPLHSINAPPCPTTGETCASGLSSEPNICCISLLHVVTPMVIFSFIFYNSLNNQYVDKL